MVICLEQGADYLHMVQLTPLPPHRLFIKIQTGLTFSVPAYQVVLEKRQLPGCLSCVIVPFGLLVHVSFCCVGFNFVHTDLSDYLGKTSPEMTYFHVECDVKPQFSQ